MFNIYFSNVHKAEQQIENTIIHLAVIRQRMMDLPVSQFK